MKTPMPKPQIRTGFTLVELLSVIAIIVVLLALLTPALESAYERALVAKCGVNQRGLVMANVSYALDNIAMLPVRDGYSGNWLWDIHVPAVRALFKYGAGGENQRDIFYCPSNAPMMLNDDFWLNGSFATNEGFIVSGYDFLIYRPGPGGGMAGGPAFLNTKYQWHMKTTELDTKATPLFMDSVLIAWGQWAGTTSHMAPGRLPGGGNQAFKDASVAWKPYENMTKNFSYEPDLQWYW